MVKRNSILLLAYLAINLFSFNTNNDLPKKATAEVATIEGLYIYTDSKPVMPYDSLGKVNIGFIVGTEYRQIRNNLIKRAKKKYPNAEGLIINYSTKALDIDEAIVIKFK